MPAELPSAISGPSHSAQAIPSPSTKTRAVRGMGPARRPVPGGDPLRAAATTRKSAACWLIWAYEHLEAATRARGGPGGPRTGPMPRTASARRPSVTRDQPRTASARRPSVTRDHALARQARRQLSSEPTRRSVSRHTSPASSSAVPHPPAQQHRDVIRPTRLIRAVDQRLPSRLEVFMPIDDIAHLIRAQLP